MNVFIIVGGIIGLVAVICLLSTFVSSWIKKEKLSDILCETATFLGVLATLICLIGSLSEMIKLM